MILELSSKSEIKSFLAKEDFRFKKSLGQNFLVDEAALLRIAELAACEGENVLEIGPGIGTMTQYLAEAAGKVVAVEIDPDYADEIPSTKGVL